MQVQALQCNTMRDDGFETCLITPIEQIMMQVISNRFESSLETFNNPGDFF